MQKNDTLQHQPLRKKNLSNLDDTHFQEKSHYLTGSDISRKKIYLIKGKMTEFYTHNLSASKVISNI